MIIKLVEELFVTNPFLIFINIKLSSEIIIQFFTNTFYIKQIIMRAKSFFLRAS